MATRLKYLLILILFGWQAHAQCNIHPNFRSIANMKGLNATYEMQLTIVGTHLNGTQYTVKGKVEICKRNFEKNCSKQLSFSMLLSDKQAEQQVYQLSVDFVDNTLQEQTNGRTKTYSNIQRKGNSFYVTAVDGTILTFSFVKHPLCLN